jgi:hypothetical protein
MGIRGDLPACELPPIARLNISQTLAAHPSEKDRDNAALEKRLWAAADQLRASSGLTERRFQP